ncbi:DNA primase [Desulfurobacterium thermolithotrophum]|uniref:DNA primase n=1 Tax=Desulfurobacterium thermolithotrophum TaxID=64160 RepID=UPI0013D7B98F|nr:DNA primase [Desulfurobacterium thermolithotrophum]
MGSLKIPYSFIQEILSRVDIVDIVSNYIQLKQVGRNYTALCPFHPEKTPSFVVSPEKQIFKCFGCGIGGNAITFVEKYENVSFFEAVRRVAEIAGIELPSHFKENEESFQIEEAGYNAASYFHSKLSSILSYLKERGISEKEAKKFLIGYAPQGYSKELNLNPKLAKELGLLNAKGREFFAERLIVPIFNHFGKIVAFAGRTLTNDKSLPKYVNSPESSLFKKNSILYGFYQSKETILKEKKVIIVEGYFDVISLHRIGVKNVVAPMGTSLTENHVKIIKQYANFPILMFDGDNAGRKATIRSAGLFFAKGIEPFVVHLPEGEDPDSMAISNPDKLKELLGSPISFIDWALNFIDSFPQREQIGYLKEIVGAILPLRDIDPVRFKLYFAKLSSKYGINEKWLLLNFRFSSRKSLTSENEEEFIPDKEKRFVRALIEKKCPPIQISPLNFTSQKVSQIVTLIQNGESIEEIQVRYPNLAGLIAEVLFLEVTEEELLKAVVSILKKELKRRMKLMNYEEKVKLAKLIQSLEKRDIRDFQVLRNFEQLKLCPTTS